MKIHCTPNKDFSGKIREARDAIRAELASDLPPFKTGLYLHVLYETEAQLSHLLYIDGLTSGEPYRLAPEKPTKVEGEEI